MTQSGHFHRKHAFVSCMRPIILLPLTQSGRIGMGRLVTCILTCGFSILVVSDRIALGQSGSTGGTIGKTDKSVSGGEAPPKIQPKKRSLAKADTRSPSRQGGGEGGVARYDGTWTGVLSPGCSIPDIILSITISGGRIMDPHPMVSSGTITPTGSFRLVGLDGGVGTGSFTGDTASGSYRAPNGCLGNIRATRN